MFEWALNMPLKLIEHNFNIYFMLFELKNFMF